MSVVWTPKMVQMVEKAWDNPSEVALRKVYAHLIKGFGLTSVLEVGCGTGMVYRALKSESITDSQNYVGLDSSCHMLDKFKEHNPEASLILAKAEEIPLANESFDIVASFEMLCHLEDIISALKEMGRVAKKLIMFSLDVSPFENTLKDVEIIETEDGEVEKNYRAMWSCSDIQAAIDVVRNGTLYLVSARILTECKWVFFIDKTVVASIPNIVIRPYLGYTSILLEKYDRLAKNFLILEDRIKELRQYAII